MTSEKQARAEARECFECLLSKDVVRAEKIINAIMAEDDPMEFRWVMNELADLCRKEINRRGRVM